MCGKMRGSMADIPAEPGKARVYGSVLSQGPLVSEGFDGDIESQPLAQQEEAQEAPVDASEDQTQGLSKYWLVAFFCQAMMWPGIVLVVHSFFFRSGCGGELAACHARCESAFEEQNRVFKSDYQPEQECKAYCDLMEQRCEGQADAVLLGAAILGGGCFFSLCLMSSLESMLESFARRSGRPRSAYKEPIFTEEEEQKMARVIGPMERAFFKFLKQEVIDIKTEEIMCRDCQVPVEVDVRWRTGDRGGMQGARCPRCMHIVVGVL